MQSMQRRVSIIRHLCYLFCFLFGWTPLLGNGRNSIEITPFKHNHVAGQTPHCNDQDSCMKLHLGNNELIRLLQGRCMIGESTRNDTEERRITFSQLPKTGGSSVREFLIKRMDHRVRGMNHEHFLLAAIAEPKNLFSTMLREPISRAISFYSYVRSLKTLHAAALANKLWARTYTTDPVYWAADPFIQRTLYQDPLGFFLRDIVNISDSITRYDYRKIKELPEVPFRSTVNGTLQQYLRYTDSMLTQYQCRQHLEVGFIFMKHYEVVGVLEDRDSFFKVLFRRAHFPNTIFLNATHIHNNPSSSTISAEDRAAMTEHLKDSLYCATVLWKIAGMINQKDLNCPL